MRKLFAKNFVILIVCCLTNCQAGDVSQASRYNRYNEPALRSQRLQRLEVDSTPYPAAGFRPRHQFNLPREQPLFPLATEQFSRNRNINNNDNFNVENNQIEAFSNAQPGLLYGAPLNDIEGSANGFQRSFSNSQDSFSNRPDLKYGAPSRENFDSLDNFQRLRSSQRASSASRSPLSTENFQPLQRSQYNLHSSAFKSERLAYNRENGLENLSRAQNNRHRSERLTDNREDREDDDYDESVTPTDIEVDSTKRVGNKKPNERGAAAPPLVTYYPASAIGFVQPLAVTSSYPLPASPLNPTASFYQSQPVVYSASGRPLQAW